MNSLTWFPDCKDWIIFGLGVIATPIITVCILKLFKPKICVGEPFIEEIDWCKNLKDEDDLSHGGDDLEKKGKNEESTNVELNKKVVIKVKVYNMSKCWSAINLRTEICIVHGKYTYHFDLDRQDFIILPKRGSLTDSNERTYICYKLNDFTARRTCYTTCNQMLEYLKNKNYYFRVRVHATHEFTGLGRAFDAKFERLSENKFLRINKKSPC